MTPAKLAKSHLADLESRYTEANRSLTEAQKFLHQSLESVTFWTWQIDRNERDVERLSDQIRAARKEMGE